MMKKEDIKITGNVIYCDNGTFAIDYDIKAEMNNENLVSSLKELKKAIDYWIKDIKSKKDENI